MTCDPSNWIIWEVDFLLNALVRKNTNCRDKDANKLSDLNKDSITIYLNTHHENDGKHQSKMGPCSPIKKQSNREKNEQEGERSKCKNHSKWLRNRSKNNFDQYKKDQKPECRISNPTKEEYRLNLGVSSS